MLAVAGLGLAAGQDQDAPLHPITQEALAPGQDVAALFRAASPEVTAIQGTAFGAVDEETGELVFRVEDDGVATRVRQALQQRGVAAGAYRIQVVEPIHFMSETLRTRHRPTVGSGLPASTQHPHQSRRSAAAAQLSATIVRHSFPVKSPARSPRVTDLDTASC